MRQETYYQVLQVDPKATQDIIEAAFRRLARKYHPDICTEQNNIEKMKELTAAYSVLRHPVTRVNYDKELSFLDQESGGDTEILARIGIVGSIIVLLAVLALSAFQGRMPAVALDGSRSAEMSHVAATDMANALLIRSAIVATLTAMPTPLAIHSTPVPDNANSNHPLASLPTVSAIEAATTGATAVGEDETFAFQQPTSDSPASEASSEPPATGQTPVDRGDQIQDSVLTISALVTTSNGLVDRGSSDSTPEVQLSPSPVATATTFAAAVPQQPQPTPTGVERTVLIIEPNNGIESGGIEIFAWERDFELETNQAIEVIFWKPGQNPVQHGFGLAVPTSDNAIAVDLDALDETLGPLLDPGFYQWGLLLVEVDPYRRLEYLGSGNDFYFANFGTHSSTQNHRRPRSGE